MMDEEVAMERADGFPDFFDLPVYRLPEEQYYLELEKFADEQVEAAGGSDRDPDTIEQIRWHAETNFGGPWQYNEIIGYIRLHFVGSQIRGEYFETSAKRIVRTRKKILRIKTHKLAPEVSIPFEPTSEQIFSLIKDYVEDCKKELPRRFIDASQLMRLGPFVDWKGLYETVLRGECKRSGNHVSAIDGGCRAPIAGASE